MAVPHEFRTLTELAREHIAIISQGKGGNVCCLIRAAKSTAAPLGFAEIPGAAVRAPGAVPHPNPHPHECNYVV